MGHLVRVYPDTPCQPKGVHHPHRWKCADPVDCGGWEYPCDYDPLTCCVCGKEWPCEERQKRDAEKALIRRSPS
jgi:hypothetical protein